VHGQKNIDELFNKFKKEERVTHVGVGKFVMKFAGIFTNVMGVTGIDVLDFSECDQSVRGRLNQAIASLKDANYETMISVNEEKERIKVLVKLKDEYIREIVVLTTGDDPSMVRIKGKIKPSDIDGVVDKNKANKG
jgi:uncharacterized protein with FMN-binding domain